VLEAKIAERLEERFRELANRRFGCQEDALKRALEEAVMRWVSMAEEEEISFDGDPVEAIDGLLKDVNMDSVELQHEARRYWASKVAHDVPG